MPNPDTEPNTRAMNAAAVSRAIALVRITDEALTATGTRARYTIKFEGFGTGCLPGVNAEAAINYLAALGSAYDPHSRYGTAITSLTVQFKVEPVEFVTEATRRG
jgi:hypothetical protein